MIMEGKIFSLFSSPAADIIIKGIDWSEQITKIQKPHIKKWINVISTLHFLNQSHKACLLAC